MSTLKEIVQENSYEPPLEMSRGLGMEFKDFEVRLYSLIPIANYFVQIFLLPL